MYIQQLNTHNVHVPCDERNFVKIQQRMLLPLFTRIIRNTKGKGSLGLLGSVNAPSRKCKPCKTTETWFTKKRFEVYSPPTPYGAGLTKHSNSKPKPLKISINWSVKKWSEIKIEKLETEIYVKTEPKKLDSNWLFRIYNKYYVPASQLICY